MEKTNKIHIVAYSVLGIAIILLAVMWYRCAAQKDKLDVAVNNSYDKAFFELSDYVSDIDVLLTKAQLASTPAQLASISNEIFMQAAEAKSCFGELPQEGVNLEKTAKFLSQVGDYTYVLSQNMINGQNISQEEYTTLGKLNDYAGELSKSLDDMEARIYKGEISFNTAHGIDLITRAIAAEDIFGDLENVEKSFEGYPSLIYDGPFSEHIENVESVMLKNAPEVSQKHALKKAKEFLGDEGKGLEFQSEMTNTAIECYVFSKDTDDGQLSVSVTKKGGYVLYFIKSRDVREMNYDKDAATAIAHNYLTEHGFTDMVSSYYEITDNTATINFAYSKNGVKMYSDLIKVRVALDIGEVTGIECKGYLMNHKDRGEQKPVLSAEAARAAVSTHLNVNTPTLAVIPKDSLREVLCYEFHGTHKDKNFIIYINAENGREEDILLLIESETGILTV
ncbi:MAG: germination protein YpeB [Clostridia bacterium]|nr:germination protein YpeB [Clostridia bacterium]